MEAFANRGRSRAPRVFPETSSHTTPIYASSINYKSPNNIADEKKKQYEQALEKISNTERKIASIEEIVDDLKSKTKLTPYDRRSTNMLQYVP